MTVMLETVKQQCAVSQSDWIRIRAESLHSQLVHNFYADPSSNVLNQGQGDIQTQYMDNPQNICMDYQLCNAHNGVRFGTVPRTLIKIFTGIKMIIMIHLILYTHIE